MLGGPPHRAFPQREGSPSRDRRPKCDLQSFPESTVGDGPLGYGVDVSRTSSHKCKTWEGAHAALMGTLSETSESVGFRPRPEEQGQGRGESGRSSSPAGPGEGAPPREDRSQQSRRDGLGPLRGLFSGEAWPRTPLPLDVWRVQAGPAFPTWPAVVCLMAPRPPGDPTPCRAPLLFGVAAVSPLVAWGPGRHRNKQPAYPLRVLAHGHLRRQEKTDFGVLDLLSLKDHRIGPGLGSSLPRRPAQREGQWQRPRGPAGACLSPHRVVLADEI